MTHQDLPNFSKQIDFAINLEAVSLKLRGQDQHPGEPSVAISINGDQETVIPLYALAVAVSELTRFWKIYYPIAENEEIANSEENKEESIPPENNNQ